MSEIKIFGLKENNLKNISLKIPKEKIVVFTGVSGSGKSSIVFDTIAAESQRQMNSTYPTYVRSRLPKYPKPAVDRIENLTPSVIVDQTPIGGNARSTVGTISGIYASLRLLFSRAGKPCVRPASFFSFNNPNGMCKSCSGIGKILEVDIKKLINHNKSWNEGCVNDSTFSPGTWYWKQYSESNLFDLDKPIKDYTKEEYNLLLYGSKDRKSKLENPKVTGLYNRYTKALLTRNLDNTSKHTQEKAQKFTKETACPDCGGKRLNSLACSSKINGLSIVDFCNLDLIELKKVMLEIDSSRVAILIQTIIEGIDRMIDIGLGYLHLNRETPSLSGGEAQRLKLIRYMGSSLTNLTYIFDEPSAGMHPRDVYRMNNLLRELRDKNNSVIVVEHDKDVISIADHIIDIGPGAGKNGGEIVFEGTYAELCRSNTLTGNAMKMSLSVKNNPRKWNKSIPIAGASLYNLKNITVEIPLNIMTVVTGVAGSGKSTLISKVFVEENKNDVILIDQGPITATDRSTPASYLGFFDEIRKLLAKENKKSEGLFSFNSTGACPVCNGKGIIVTELAFMDPIVTECEECCGLRYNSSALNCKFKGKNIVELLSMTVSEALNFYDNRKIIKNLEVLEKVGLSYLTLGQPLSTLSGGERQRLKLAKNLGKKGNIIVMDEPTTGLHMSDIKNLLKLFDNIINYGNTLIIIEHNLDVIGQADWVIDIGPDGGKNGGEVVFVGTPCDMIKYGKTITSDYLRKDLEI